MTDLTMSQFASKDDLIAAQAARIAELEAEVDAERRHHGIRNASAVRTLHALGYSWRGADAWQPPAPQAVQPSVLKALLNAEAALEVAISRILKSDPGHSISVTSEAKALVAVRAALNAASQPAAQGMEALGANGLQERSA